MQDTAGKITPDNIFASPKTSLANEIFDTILEKGGVRVERIVSHGQSSPEGFWYDQDKAEWVMVLEGRGVIEFQDGQNTDMRKGDHIYIAPHRKHRVAFTAPDADTLWLAIHFEI